MLAGIPGMEPSEPGDMKDVLYQSKGFLNGFIDWLELEAAKDDTKVDTRGPQSGWWPFYGTSLAKEFPTVEAKRAYIQAMLENMTNVLNKPESIWSHMLFLSSLGITGIIVALIVAKKTAL